MADLWGALEEVEPIENPTVTVAIKTPDAVLNEDLINLRKIQGETELLKKSLDCSAQIVIAAYKVADYVPNLNNSQHREFWEQQVSLILCLSNENSPKYSEIFMRKSSAKQPKPYSTLLCVLHFPAPSHSVTVNYFSESYLLLRPSIVIAYCFLLSFLKSNRIIAAD